jgi:hypothetical protein
MNLLFDILLRATQGSHTTPPRLPLVPDVERPILPLDTVCGRLPSQAIRRVRFLGEPARGTPSCRRSRSLLTSKTTAKRQKKHGVCGRRSLKLSPDTRLRSLGECMFRTWSITANLLLTPPHVHIISQYTSTRLLVVNGVRYQHRTGRALSRWPLNPCSLCPRQLRTRRLSR